MSPSASDPVLSAAAVTQRLRTLSGVIAPTTLITSLLFYFGYVATLARFQFFGIYLDLVGLSTQQTLLYGVEVAYVPIILLGLCVLLVLALHLGCRWLLARPARAEAVLWAGVIVVLLAVLLLIRGLIGILIPQVSIDEYPSTTPLCLSSGSLLLAYGYWLVNRYLDRRAQPGTRIDTTWITRIGATACIVVAIAGLFWAANTFAAAYGSGRAQDQAAGLADQPEIVLDTAARLTGLPASIQATEQKLPAEEGQSYRYQYRGLRLLVAAGDRLFLVPGEWTGDARTIVLANDESIRMQLIPEQG